MGQTSRTRLLTAGVLITVFGSGILVGLVLDSELGASPTPELSDVQTSEAPEVVDTTEAEADEDDDGFECCIYHKVEPNEFQLARIDSIVQEHRNRRDALDEALNAEREIEHRAILLDTRESIKSVLTPEQASEYQHLLDEWDAQEEQREAERANGDESG